MDMQFKKFALRGMIILAIVIALCILFSGTLRTLATPKVAFAEKRTGKIEQNVDLEGSVVFPDQFELSLRVPEGLGLTVTKIHVINGQKMKAGDVLISTEVTEVESKLEELQGKVDEAMSELEEWQRKHSDIRLSRNEQLWMDAYEAAREAEAAELEVRLALMTELNVSKASKLTEKNVSKGSDEAKALYTQWQDAVKAMETAQKKQENLNRYAVDEDTWKTLKDKQASLKKKNDAESQMIKIRLLEKQVGTIRAPHDGYVIELKVEKGSSLTGENVLLLYTPEGVNPVIRAETKKTDKPIQKGAEIYILPEDSSRGRKVKTKVISTGVTDTGIPCADAEITDDVIYEHGSVSSMLQKKISMRVISRAKESSTLITAAAVQGNGDNCFIYIAEPFTTMTGETRYRLREQKVTVLGRNDEWCAIEDDYYFGDVKIAYLWDRQVKEGDTVMEYEGAKQK